jgi:hypothetical protein
MYITWPIRLGLQSELCISLSPMSDIRINKVIYLIWVRKLMTLNQTPSLVLRVGTIYKKKTCKKKDAHIRARYFQENYILKPIFGRLTGDEIKHFIYKYITFFF